MSEFATWFEAQFGKRNSHMSGSDKDLEDLVTSGLRAERELKRREMWDERYEAALYGWQASRSSDTGEKT
jgi:hypothetical protein